MSMKILHFWNAGSHPYHYVDMLRKKDIDSELLFPEGGVRSHPLWDILDTDREELINKYGENYKKPWMNSNRDKLPEWTTAIPHSCEEFDYHNYYTPTFVARMVRNIRQINPDLVHAWTHLAAIIAMFSGKRYLYHVTGESDWDRWKRIDNPILGKVYEQLCRQAVSRAETVFSAPDLVPQIESEYGVNVESPPHAMDTNYFQPQEPDTSLKDSYDCDLLLFVGAKQDWELKRNDIFFKGLAECSNLPDYHVLALDMGVDKGRSKSLVSKLGLEEVVSFIPPMTRPKLIRLLNTSDVVVDTLRRGIGTLGLQTLCCATPLMGSFEDDWNRGWFGEVESPPILKATSQQAVQTHLKDLSAPSRRKEIGNKSRQWIEENYNWNDTIQAHIDIYQRILL